MPGEPRCKLKRRGDAFSFYGGEGVRHPTHPGIELEAEAGLEIDDSRSKGARRLTEVATADVIRNGAGVDIQRIEYIDEVGLDFDLGVFPNQTHVGQAESLGKIHIEVAVLRPGKGVAPNSRRRDEGGCELSRIVCDGICIVWNSEVVVAELIIVRAGTCSARAWKVASGFEGAIAGAAESSAVVGRTQALESVVALVAVDLVPRRISRCPPVTGVEGKDSANRPAAGYLLFPVMAAAKDGRLPDAKELEVIGNVEIRPSIREPGVVKIGAAVVWARIRIKTMAPGILRLQRESL